MNEDFKTDPLSSTPPAAQPLILNKEEVRAIRERAEAATEGPWRAGRHIDRTLYGVLRCQDGTEDEREALIGCLDHIPDATFCAAARTDVPRLCATVESLAVKHDEFVALAKEVEKRWGILRAENEALRGEVSALQERDERLEQTIQLREYWDASKIEVRRLRAALAELVAIADRDGQCNGPAWTAARQALAGGGGEG